MHANDAHLGRRVAALLTRVRKARKAGLKDTVNEALRHGPASSKPRRPYRTPSVSVGRYLLDNVDDVDAVLDFAEGAWRR